MIANLHAEDSTASRCLDLIARHAPKFMRCGGGPISQPMVIRPRLKESEVRRVLELAETGRYSITEISQHLKCAHATVQVLLLRRGIKVPHHKTLHRKLAV